MINRLGHLLYEEQLLHLGLVSIEEAPKGGHD